VIIRSGANETPFARADVREVRIRTGKDRLRKTGIGAAIGTAVGLAIAGIVLAATGGSDETGIILAGGAFYGGAIGAGVGVALPEGWWTIYRRP